MGWREGRRSRSADTPFVGDCTPEYNTKLCSEEKRKCNPKLIPHVYWVESEHLMGQDRTELKMKDKMNDGGKSEMSGAKCLPIR